MDSVARGLDCGGIGRDEADGDDAVDQILPDRPEDVLGDNRVDVRIICGSLCCEEDGGGAAQVDNGTETGRHGDAESLVVALLDPQQVLVAVVKNVMLRHASRPINRNGVVLTLIEA